ncbi:MAG TPA: hypothetical protein VJ142_01145 [Candidatus Nanoarchaeia archaeon]|nr:hypothetical protein [Candidatus Nanoarchaeia archaeon]
MKRFKDPIQEKLKQMEGENPSKNEHTQGLLKTLKNRIYFMGRFLGIEEKIYNFLGSEIFLKKPLRYELSVPIYSQEELGDLSQKEFPTTIDRKGRWTNSHYSHSSLMDKIFSRLISTHIIYFSPTSDGSYRFDVKHA